MLGGNKYTNMLYGKDELGQFITFTNNNNTSNNDDYYSIVSKKQMDKHMGNPGFVAAQSYNRSELLNETKENEFVVHGQSYSGMKKSPSCYSFVKF